MQTFLPYPDFDKSARCLDDKRLGNQRREALIIFNTLTRGEGGWINHPAVEMWKGYENALACYFDVNVKEWRRRGFKNNMLLIPITRPIVYPPWIGDETFHASHRSNLLRKNPEFYKQFGWTEPDNLPYVWPVK